jgi:perosamine synthetase
MIIDALKDIECLNLPNDSNRRPSWYAFVMIYKPEVTGIPIEEFYALLKDEGLNDIDRPRSTRPLHQLALFSDKSIDTKVCNRFSLFSSCKSQQEQYPQAMSFYRNAIKMPIWTRACDKPMVEKYIQAIKKVSLQVMGCTPEKDSHDSNLFDCYL